MMLVVLFFSFLLNLNYGSIVEHSDIGVIEEVETENNSPSSTKEIQYLLRRRLLPGGISTDDKTSLLNAHNTYRDYTAKGNTNGQPSATNMNELIWDTGLAQLAQEYSSKCIWAHNGNRHTDMTRFTGSASFDYTNQQVGENLFITTGSESLSSLLQGVKYWYDEYIYYTYGTVSGTASCTSGKQCGHYTQLIWGTTRYVGCGYTKCGSTSGISFQNAVLLVCNYYFSGNIVGYYPYTVGTTGTQCSSDRVCQNNLCTGCPNPSWDKYCCPYCSSSSCNNAISSNLLNSPSSCTNGLGTSMSSSSSSSTTTTTRSPTTKAPTTTKSPTTSSPTTKAPTTTRSPTSSSSSSTNSPTTTTTTTTTRTPTTTASSSNSNGCCKPLNTRYTTFCASISTSSVCGTYSSLCSWGNSC